MDRTRPWRLAVWVALSCLVEQPAFSLESPARMGPRVACQQVASTDLSQHDANDLPTQSCIPRERCCKICSKGKACGNSCIRRDYTCRKGRGCACNAYELYR